HAVTYHLSATAYVEGLIAPPAPAATPLLAWSPTDAPAGALNRARAAATALRGRIVKEAATFREDARRANVLYFLPDILPADAAAWFTYPTSARLLVAERTAPSTWATLQRAAQYHGAKNLLVHPTGPLPADGALLRFFWEHLQTGAPMAEALHLAQLDCIADPNLAAPHHWAEWRLIGNPGLTLSPEEPLGRWLIWGLGLLLGLSFVVGIRRYWARQFKRRYVEGA
ncbi:MAG: CHAT domain-containing protein, partial [Catalinimonas sp.]